jgi:hypothetical protein
MYGVPNNALNECHIRVNPPLHLLLLSYSSMNDSSRYAVPWHVHRGGADDYLLVRVDAMHA